MKFIDKINLLVTAGTGGRGAIAFRRELYVPRGGPSGGDGGRGGDVYFIGDSNLNTLFHLNNNTHIKGNNGKNGATANRTGAEGKAVYIHVPVGTVIIDVLSQKQLADISHSGAVHLIAKGGQGGKGNAHFATSRKQTPSVYENGEPGQHLKIECNLKLLANVGLIGLPNAGKSTLLNVISNAKAKAANYAFTTLQPQLGMVHLSSTKSFVIADLPGLVENANLGKGLGHQFLKHIERCVVLAHLVDMSGNFGQENPFDNYQIIRQELQKYSQALSNKPQIIVGTKMDLSGAAENLADFKGRLQESIPIIAVSAFKNQNLARLKEILWNFVMQHKPDPVVAHEDSAPPRLYKFEAPTTEFIIEKIRDNAWRVSGATIDQLYNKYPITTYDNWLMFKKKAFALGLIQKIEQHNPQENDEIIIKNQSLTWINHDLV